MIFQFGEKKIFRFLQVKCVDGLIVVDLPCQKTKNFQKNVTRKY